MSGFFTRLKLIVPPSDRALLFILLLGTVVACIAWAKDGGGMLAAGQHLSLLLVLVLCIGAMAKWEQAWWVWWVRSVVSVALVFSLYASLGVLGLAATTYRADAMLSHVDLWLLGFDPAMEIQAYQTFGWVAFYSFVYSAFIPYVYLSMFLGCIGRPPIEREQFLTGWVFTYVISFVGYLFLPAQGPVVFQADQFTTALEGGSLHWLVVSGIDAVGGPKGAFPSLHVGASVYLCFFDLRTNRLRGLTYLPIVLLIYVATIFLRYHYVVDLLAGTVIGMMCVPIGRYALLSWTRARREAKLPALPGSEEPENE